MSEDEKCLKLLIVEDDLIDRKQLQRLLSNSAIGRLQIETAETLRQALDKLQKSIETQDYFDVVLLDLNLPDSSGLVTMDKLLQQFPIVTVIVITGEGGEGLGLEAVSRGAQDYLIKGQFDVTTLTKSIYFSKERKKTERELKKSETRFRTIVTNIPGAIYRCYNDSQWTMIFLSDEIMNISGYPAADFINNNIRSFKSIVYEPDREHVTQKIACAVENRTTYIVDYRIVNKNGEIHWVHEKGQGIFGTQGQLLYLDGVIFDITERKESEEALRESEQKFRSVVDNVGIGISMISPEMKILSINRKMKEWFPDIDLSQESFCYRSFNNPPREDICSFCPTCKTLQDGQMHEAISETPAGDEIRNYRVVSTPIRDENGKIVAAIELVEDITVQNQAKKKLEKAYQEIEKANQELKEMQSQIVQNEKLASIGQLAAGVAHEMNTPVGFVASNFETLGNYMNKIKNLLKEYDELVTYVEKIGKEQVKEKIDVIKKAKELMHIDFIMEDIDELFNDSREGLERVTSIIQNLRDFSRIDQAGEFVEYNLNNGINATLVVARNAVKYDADVVTEFGEVPPVFCNSGQINQVFLNIIVNAAQAIKSQDREGKGNITIKTYAEDNDVVCKIIDDGPGIPEDVLNKVFDPFFTTKPAGKGTGLGLSVSYDIIVSKHKGKLSVESSMGQGTTFTIKLPLLKQNAEQRPQNPEVKALDMNVV